MAQKTKDKDGKVPGNPKDVKPASDGRAAFETATASGRPFPVQVLQRQVGARDFHPT